MANLTLPYEDWVAMLAEQSLDKRMQMALEFIAKSETIGRCATASSSERMTDSTNSSVISTCASNSRAQGEPDGTGGRRASRLETKLRDLGMPEATLEELKEVTRMRRMPPMRRSTTSLAWQVAGEHALDRGHHRLYRSPQRS